MADYPTDANGFTLLVCGACNFIDATLAGCEACGATDEDMMGWYA